MPSAETATRERAPAMPAARAGSTSAGCSMTLQVLVLRSRRATRTSPATVVKVAYAVPLIERSTAGSLPPPSGTGADQSPPEARAAPYTVPPLTNAITSRPSSAAPTTGCVAAVASPGSIRVAGVKPPPSKRETKTWSMPSTRLT
jgi:hypothetical protein